MNEGRFDITPCPNRQLTVLLERCCSSREPDFDSQHLLRWLTTTCSASFRDTNTSAFQGHPQPMHTPTNTQIAISQSSRWKQIFGGRAGPAGSSLILNYRLPR